MPTSKLAVDGVSKRYGATQALSDVSLQFGAGEIHAVLGENGAGKSTLVGVLAGFVRPDAGTVSLDGKPMPLGRSHAAKSLGIEMVHQHFMLVPEFTVLENLALSNLSGLVGRADLKTLAAEALESAEKLGWTLDLEARTGDLPVGIQQRVEILKAISGGAQVVILDEPTAVLSPDEVLELFGVLRRLRDEGRTVVLIAHKLSEVLAVADRVSVLRRGEFVASAPIHDVDEKTLASWMVGDVPDPKVPLPPTETPPSLSLKDVHVRGGRGEMAVRGVSFEAAPGEILGIGGVDGNGQVELAEAIVGVRALESGQMDWLGESKRLAYVPQDRQAHGLALEMSIRDNLLITGHLESDLTRGPLLRLRSIAEWARALIERFRIKVGSPSDPVMSLSGGNQQKVVVSRALGERPDLLVAVNPTRGLDIGATAYVHEAILQATREGATTLVFSTDLDELAALATRTVFLQTGRLAESIVGSSE